MRAEQVHCTHDSRKVSIPPPCVIGLWCALYREKEENIAKAKRFPAECLIDQRRVGIDGKKAIPVRLTKAQNVCPAHKRFSAGEHIKMRTERFAVADDPVHFFISQIIFVAVCA